MDCSCRKEGRLRVIKREGMRTRCRRSDATPRVTPAKAVNYWPNLVIITRGSLQLLRVVQHPKSYNCL